MARIYVASSWRNAYYPEVVRRLLEAGHQLYDFRNPPDGKGGFFWKDIGPDWQEWSVSQYVESLKNPWAEYGFKRDYDAMKDSDACVLVLPCGRSAHSEAGWMAGAGKKVIAYIPEKQEPELMYKLFTAVTDDFDEVLRLLQD